RTLFPTKEECEAKGVDHKYYAANTLNRADKTIIVEIIWDLIMERVLTPGNEQSDASFPFVSLTTFGETYARDPSAQYYDADRYVAFLEQLAPDLNPIILQYAQEGINCYRRLLLFASAVMFGAAAEITVLSLLEAIRDATNNAEAKLKLTNMLEGAKLPTIFETITKTLEQLTKNDTIPYSIHQGCNEHLLSLFEMIRVQRNDAVHPKAGEVNRDKVFLTMQTLPTGISCVYKLIGWFNSNEV
ncbi:unnamed protein product, partial [marine sediment metagenome]